MEMVPGDVAAEVSRQLSIPTIGIGAGNGCDGQVLVWQDAFGLRTGKMARFVKQYADLHGILTEAAQAYSADVKAGDRSRAPSTPSDPGLGAPDGRGNHLRMVDQRG